MARTPDRGPASRPVAATADPATAVVRDWWTETAAERDARGGGAGIPAWWRGPAGVVAVCVVVQGLMVWWAVDHGLLYGLGDAASRMTIARRLWGSSAVGIPQLGTGWLPLPQLLLSVPALAAALWRTGLAGAVVGLACAVTSAGAVFRVAERAGAGRAGAWVAALILIANPSWAYVASVPSAEPVLIASLCLATAGLMRWTTSEPLYSPGMVVLFCGLPTAAAMLSGYEGWAFFAAALVLVSVSLRQRFGRGTVMRRQLTAFVFLPLVSIVWWFCFNWAVAADFLAWARGPYSAQAQIADLARLGLLPADGHPLVAAGLYGRTLLDVVGSGAAAAAVAGVVVALVRWRGVQRELWVLLFVPGLAVIASLAIGQTVIELPQSAPSGLENTRYGLDALPLVAVAAALLLRPSALGSARRASPAGAVVALGVVLAVCTGFLTSGWPSSGLVVSEAQRNAQADRYAADAAGWVRAHTAHGLVLVDDHAFPDLPQMGVDLRRVLARFSGPAWTRAVREPQLASWAIAEPGDSSDRVWASLSRSGALSSSFYPVASFGAAGAPGGYYVVYQREDPARAASSELVLPATSYQGQKP